MRRRTFLSQSATTVTTGTLGSQAFAMQPHRPNEISAQLLINSADAIEIGIGAIRRFSEHLHVLSQGRLSLSVEGVDEIVPAVKASGSNSGSNSLTVSTEIDDGFHDLRAGFEALQRRPFELPAEEFIVRWFTDQSSGQAQSQCEDKLACVVPISLYGDALGVWSRFPIESFADLKGVRIAGSSHCTQFLEQSGAQLVDVAALNSLERAIQSDQVDLVLSQGAVTDDALGLFTSGFECAAPSWQQIVRTGWVAVSIDKADAQSLAFDLVAVLQAAAMRSVAGDYLARQQLNRKKLDEKVGDGFVIKQLPSSVVDSLYLTAEAFRQGSGDINASAAINRVEQRDGVGRLTRYARAGYDRFLT